MKTMSWTFTRQAFGGPKQSALPAVCSQIGMLDWWGFGWKPCCSGLDREVWFGSSKSSRIYMFSDLKICKQQHAADTCGKGATFVHVFSIMLVFGLHLANCKWQQWPMISLYDVNRTTQAGSGSPAQLLCAVHFHLDGGSWRNAGNNYPKVHGRVSESRFFDIESIQKLSKPSFDAMKAFRCGQLPALCLSGTARFSTAPLPKKIAVVGCGQTGPQFCNLYILRPVLVLSLLNLWSRAW